MTPPASVLTEQDFPDYLSRAELLGFDTLWLSDIPLGALGDPIVALAFAPGKTSRLKLGANIVPLGRKPLWIAKQIAQLDRFSNRRALISLGPGLGQPGSAIATSWPTGFGRPKAPSGHFSQSWPKSWQMPSRRPSRAMQG